MSGPGVILSCAKVGQGGKFHVNERPQEYIIQQMERKHFTYDKNSTTWFRRQMKGRKEGCMAYWYKDTVLVFRKR